MHVVDFIAVRPSDQQIYDLAVLVVGDNGDQQVLRFEGSIVYSDGARVPRSVDFIEELAAQIGGHVVYNTTGD